MPYAEGRIIHDADSHVMETPDWLIAHADPEIRACLEPLRLAGCKPGEETFIDDLRRRHRDPAERAEAEEKLMVRKNWSAIGSFVREDRRRGVPVLDGLPARRRRSESPEALRGFHAHRLGSREAEILL